MSACQNPTGGLCVRALSTGYPRRPVLQDLHLAPMPPGTLAASFPTGLYVDHPLRDRQGKTIPSLTRVEVFGSPAMGWTRVVADDVAPGLFRFETQPWPPRQPSRWRRP